MAFPSVKAAAALLLLLVVSGSLAADFSMRSLTVFININKDGSANVEERLLIQINDTQSRELYDITRAAYSDLATWKARTSLSEMRHHVSRAAANITNLRILPQAVERCNPYVPSCHATVIISYTITASSNGSGLIYVDHYKPRTARYSLMPSALSFDQTKTGDLVLPFGTNISVSIPASSDKICFSTLPLNVGEQDFSYSQPADLRYCYYTGAKRVFIWQDSSLSSFQFTYEIESPLESEVIDFFGDAQVRVVGVFTGRDGLAAVIMLAAAAVSIWQLSRVSSR